MLDKNLKYYRLKKRMTKKDLASQCGVTAMAITNYEKGVRHPSPELVAKLAKALGLQSSDLTMERKTDLALTIAELKKRSGWNKSRQDFVRESVEEYFQRFFMVVDTLGGVPLPEPFSVRPVPRSGNLKQDAIALRQLLHQCERGPLQDLAVLLESQGLFIFEADVPEEQFCTVHGQVNTYPFISVNKNLTPEEKRIAIIQELAEMLFTGSEDLDEKELEHLAEVVLIGDEDLQIELGVHRKRITNDFLLVCRKYGISMRTLLRRAQQKNIVSETQAQEFSAKANKIGWKEKTPSFMVRAHGPMLLKQIVCRAVNEEELSIQKGSELLQLPYSEVAKLCRSFEFFQEDVK